jgi:hypothetical protein
LFPTIWVRAHGRAEPRLSFELVPALHQGHPDSYAIVLIAHNLLSMLALAPCQQPRAGRSPPIMITDASHHGRPRNWGCTMQCIRTRSKDRSTFWPLGPNHLTIWLPSAVFFHLSNQAPAGASYLLPLMEVGYCCLRGGHGTCQEPWRPIMARVGWAQLRTCCRSGGNVMANKR